MRRNAWSANRKIEWNYRKKEGNHKEVSNHKEFSWTFGCHTSLRTKTDIRTLNHLKSHYILRFFICEYTISVPMQYALIIGTSLAFNSYYSYNIYHHKNNNYFKTISIRHPCSYKKNIWYTIPEPLFWII